MVGVNRLLAMVLLAAAAAAQTPQAGEVTQSGEVRVEGRFERTPSVGMRARIEDIVLPGSELKAKPAEVDAPIVLRVLAARAHGTAFRYDLEYYALDPGRFDLAPYLMRVDGTATEGLPEISVVIQPQLPPGQVEPHPLRPLSSPGLGGYQTWVTVAIVVWVLGLMIIVGSGHRRRRLESESAEIVITLADRLRPLVESAQRGELGETAKAELERVLLAYWRRRLGLGNERAGRAMTQLRDHEDAGPLLRQLEVWLHKPGTGDEVEIGRLLEPYRDTPADFDHALEKAGAS